jgi:16S rRNA G966 N2-methylase RsmD
MLVETKTLKCKKLSSIRDMVARTRDGRFNILTKLIRNKARDL